MEISATEYEEVKHVWDTLGFKTLQDFHDVYLSVDILVLVDIFEEFRSRIHSYYGLEPLRYFTTPGISFDAALKYTGVKLDLISDANLYIFMER